MEIAAVIERVGAIASVRANTAAGVDVIESGLVAVREVQAWCDAQHAGLVQQLSRVDSFPEQRIAKASKQSLGRAAKSTERSKTLTKTPRLADALGDGAVTADHIDAVTRASKKLDANRRGSSWIVPMRWPRSPRPEPSTSSPAAWTSRPTGCRTTTASTASPDNGGTPRAPWVDVEGMWNLSAKFDPVTGVRIAARIDAMVQALFGESVPDECPDDPIEKQRYLAANAIARLLLDEALSNVGDHDAESTDDCIAATDRTAEAGQAGVRRRHRRRRRRAAPAPSANSPSPSRSPPASSPPSPGPLTSTPSSCATASCSTHPAS